MKIILKYYSNKGELKTFSDENKIKNPKVSFVRFKVLKNTEWPCCDFHGECTNKAYAEVYPSLVKNSKKKGWSYLCRKHYYEEQKRLNWKLPACLSVEW